MADKKDEDLTAVHRFGSLMVRFSMMSMRWLIFDGIVIMGTERSSEEAIAKAKVLSGMTEADEDLLVPIPPVSTDFGGFTMSPEVAANIPGLSKPTSPVLSGPSEPSEIPPPEPAAPPPPPPPPAGGGPGPGSAPPAGGGGGMPPATGG